MDTLPSALQSVTQAVRSGSQGVIGFFYGDSGTDKTMAAIDVASALGVPILRVDLNTIISKYIGETEKNLKRLVGAAERLNSILFFDEADALFSKRTDINDVNDRYAKIDIEYLLRCLEGFHGLVILASNLKDSIDMTYAKKFPNVLRFPLRSTD